MEKTYQNLVLAKYKYDAAIAKIENTLRNKVKFEFAVLFQQSDGFVILHTEETRNVLCMSSGTCMHFQISYTTYVPLLIHGVRCSCFFNF